MPLVRALAAIARDGFLFPGRIIIGITWRSGLRTAVAACLLALAGVKYPIAAQVRPTATAGEIDPDIDTIQ